MKNILIRQLHDDVIVLQLPTVVLQLLFSCAIKPQQDWQKKIKEESKFDMNSLVVKVIIVKMAFSLTWPASM